MPSLIGYSSLPLYEAFFFEKPVFYTKKLLDENLREFVNEIDIKDLNSLANEIINFNNNKNKHQEKIKKAKIYFEKYLSDKQITDSYRKFFKKIIDSQKIYK